MPSTATSRLEGLTTSVAVKAPCRLVTTANVSLSGLAAIGAVTPAEGDRILVNAQTSSIENGIYNAASGAWTRAKDCDGSRDLVDGTIVFVRGSVVFYRASVTDPVVIGTDPIEFVNIGPTLPDSLIITLPMFGADSDATDNSEALQDFFDFVETNRCVASWDGVFDIQDNVIIGANVVGHDSTNQTSTVIGRLSLRVTAPISGAVITNKSHRGVQYGSIEIGPKTGSTGETLTWSNRFFDEGIHFEEQAQRQLWDYITVAYSKFSGVTIDGVSPNNVHGTHFGLVDCYGCGSGMEWSSGTYASACQSSAYTAYTRNGSSGSFTQNTVLTVTTLPAEIVDEGGVKFIWIGNSASTMERYPVSTINRATNAITIWGWVPSTLNATGTLYYVFGGGLVTYGGDAGVLSGKVISSACSSGIQAGALYPGHYTAIFSHCHNGITVGTGPDQASVGGSLIGYFEGCECDIFFCAAPATHGYRVLSQHALNLNKVRHHRARLTDNSFSGAELPQSLMISYRGRDYVRENEPTSTGERDRCSVSLDSPFGATIPLVSDSPIINIVILPSDNTSTNADVTRLFGRFAREVEIRGTGGKDQPTGTLTVNPPALHTINGGVAGAAATFTGFTAMVKVRIEADPASSTNWIVKITRGRPLFGTATYDPPSLAAGAVSTIQTMTVTGAALGDAVSMSFSNSLAGAVLHGWLSATNTVSFYFHNLNGANPLDLGSGTVTARIIQ
jgi:hypothetical protein